MGLPGREVAPEGLPSGVTSRRASDPDFELPSDLLIDQLIDTLG